MGEQPQVSTDSTTAEQRARQDYDTLMDAARWAEQIMNRDQVYASMDGARVAFQQLADGCRTLAEQVRITRRPMSVTLAEGTANYDVENRGDMRDNRGETTSVADGTVWHTTTAADGTILEAEIHPPGILDGVRQAMLQPAHDRLARMAENWDFLREHATEHDAFAFADTTMVGVLGTLPRPLLAATLAVSLRYVALGSFMRDTPNTSGDMPA